ncbi:MAG: hypothetical protein ACREIA_12030 [Opitutaceae bacterium]
MSNSKTRTIEASRKKTQACTPGEEDSSHRSRFRAFLGYVLSVCTICTATVLAARRFPEEFDWVYTVMSALASRKHNPDGGLYFASGLALSLAFLWPSVSWIKSGVPLDDRLGRIGARALRAGIILGMLVGVERLIFFHLSQVIRKGHEILALLCFLNLYAGVVLISLGRIRRAVGGRWPAVLVLAPLVAIGLNQLALYFDQRDLGWVDTSWRDMGIGFWMSFAFWQWLAAAMLWAGIGQLVFTSGRSEGRGRKIPDT